MISWFPSPPLRNRVSITNTSGSDSIKAGQSAVYDLQVTPNGKFPRTLALTLSPSCPPLATCTFNPSTLAAGSGSTRVQLTIATSAAVLVQVQSLPGRIQVPSTLALALPGLVMVFGGRRSRRSRRHFACLLLLTLAALLLISACGGGLEGGATASAQPGTPPGTYDMSVSATPDAPSTPAAVALIVN